MSPISHSTVLYSHPLPPAFPSYNVISCESKEATRSGLPRDSEGPRQNILSHDALFTKIVCEFQTLFESCWGRTVDSGAIINQNRNCWHGNFMLMPFILLNSLSLLYNDFTYILSIQWLILPECNHTLSLHCSSSTVLYWFYPMLSLHPMMGYPAMFLLVLNSY